MSLALSHFELNVRDLARMEAFYADVLGLTVSDRSDAMVFMTSDPREHHQIVLNRGTPPQQGGAHDHVALRAPSLAELRRYAAALADAGVATKAVSHGNSWSIYFEDPEANRLEIFVDTPWYVPQPAYFEFDLSLGDVALIRWTERKLAEVAGVMPIDDWRASKAQPR